MKIAIVTSGLTGILNASYQVGKELQEAGHEIIFLSLWEGVKEKIETQGFDCIEFPKLNFKYKASSDLNGNSASKINTLRSLVFNPNSAYRKGVESLKLEEITSKLKSLNPEFLFIDIELHEYIISAFSLKLPIIILNQWMSNVPRYNLPPINTIELPSESIAGNKKTIMRWIKMAFKHRIRDTKNRLVPARNRESVLRYYAIKNGFPSRWLSYSFWPPQFNYHRIPIWSLNLKELDFPHEIPQNLDYVGISLFANRKDIESKEEKEHLQHLFTKGKKEKLKTIYCSFSTLKKGDFLFLNKVIEAVGKESNWQMIISASGKEDDALKDELPSNCHRFDFVPQLEVLQHADLSINHGGIHTINDCIVHAVPMLVYSGNQFDQNGCAARVQYHGLGIMANRQTDQPDDIRSKIKFILDDESIARNLKNFQRIHLDNVRDKLIIKRFEEIRDSYSSGQLGIY